MNKAVGAMGRFVLLAVNGGDAPVTAEHCKLLATLPGMVACFANNLHWSAAELPASPLLPFSPPAHHTESTRACADDSPRGLRYPADPARFRPLPLGLPGADERPLAAARRAGRPWVLRDRRLLIPPMKATNRLRGEYLAVLGQPEYAHLVR